MDEQGPPVQKLMPPRLARKVWRAGKNTNSHDSYAPRGKTTTELALPLMGETRLNLCQLKTSKGHSVATMVTGQLKC
eukprot:1677290-Amphidinium_carterae.1